MNPCNPLWRSAIALAFFSAAGLTLPAGAATLYWDPVNGNTSGVGTATPDGTWSAAVAAWGTSAGTGIPAVWTNGNHNAIFSAGSDATGSFTVTVAEPITLSDLTVQEGQVTLTGDPFTLATNSAWNGGGGLTVHSNLLLNAKTLAITGSVEFLGSVTIDNRITVNNGTLRLGGNNTGAGGIRMDNSNASVIVASNTAMGSGVFEWGNGSLSAAAGDWTLNNAITILDNTLDFTGSGNLTFTGAAALGGSARTFTTTGPGALHLAGGITGIRAVTKAGAGLMTLGDSDYTRTTTINGGTYLVNGTHSGGESYTVAAGATLGGTGSIRLVAGQSVSINGASGNAGTLNPGDGLGTLTIGQAATPVTVNFNNFSRLLIDLDAAAADRLDIFGPLNLHAGASLAFSVTTAPTLGQYVLVTHTGTRTGTFGAETDVPSGYRVAYLPNQVELVQRAVIDPAAAPVDAVVILGGSTAIGVTVTNAAQPGGDALTQFTATGVGSGVSGHFSGGPVNPQSAAGDSASIVFDSTGQSIGVNSRSVSVSSTDAGVVSPVAAGFDVTVLAHADAAIQNITGGDTVIVANAGNDVTIDFGVVALNAGGGSLLGTFDLANLLAVAGFTAGLDLDDYAGTGDTGVLALTGLTAFTNLAAGSAAGYTLTFDTTGLGSFTATHVFRLSDQDLPGASGPQSEVLTLTAIGQVVPEPASAALVLAGCGLIAWRKRGGAGV